MTGLIYLIEVNRIEMKCHSLERLQTCCINIRIVQMHGKNCTLSAHNSNLHTGGGEGVEDATLTLLDTVSKHLDSTGNFVRILFMDFSSAFNTIQPHLLIQRLLDLQVNPTLVLWIRAFLCDRPQRVCVRVDPLSVWTGGGSLSECTVLPGGSVMSKEFVLDTGAPRGVLCPLFFFQYI